MAPQRVFKTLMEPYDLVCENRAGFLGMITDGGHVVRTALQREDFVRIVLAGQYSPASCRSSPSAIWLVAELLVQKISTLFFSVRCSGAINHSQ
jgi:hypothetical protein